MIAPRFPFLRFLPGALLLFGVCLGSPAQSAPPAAGAGPGTTALMVFLSYQGNQELVISPTELRLIGSHLYAAAVESGHRRVVTYPELTPVMRRWRIRSDRSLSREALEAVVAETGADRVLVARLEIYADRLIALTRELEPESGRLVSVGVAEESIGDLWSDAQTARDSWNEAVGRAAAQLAGQRAKQDSDPAAEILVVLPVTPIGVASGHSDVAMHCVLRSLLDTGRWSLPDPSLARSALWAAGYDPSALEASGRSRLADVFGAHALLLPRLVAFDKGGRANGPMLDEEDYGVRALSLGPEARIPLHLSLVMVDCGTGRVLSANDAYLEPEDPFGLFGIVKNIRVADRLKSGSERLVNNMLDIEGDS